MKQYLFMIDDRSRGLFEALCPGLQFLEIQGMNVNTDGKFQLLATPIIPPVNMMVVDSTVTDEAPELKSAE